MSHFVGIPLNFLGFLMVSFIFMNIKKDNLHICSFGKHAMS